MNKTSLPILAEHSKCCSVADYFVICSKLGTKSDPGLAGIETDLLVLTAATNANLSRLFSRAGESLGGALAEATASSQFTGQISDAPVVVAGGKHSRARFVMLAGIGSFALFRGETVCHLFQRVLEVARAKGAKKITLVIPPNRQTEERINLKGTAAIVACRLGCYLQQHPDFAAALQVEFYCTPQAARFLSQGLAVKAPRCSVCTD